MPYDPKTGGRAFVDVTVQVELEYLKDMPEDNNALIERHAFEAVQAAIKRAGEQKFSTMGVFAVALRPTKTKFDIRVR